MSKESEDKFDEFQAEAKSSQMVVIYIMGVLPSGQAVNVTTKMLPEELEVIGQFPDALNKARPWRHGLTAKVRLRGDRIANLITKQINPAILTLLEALIRKHYSQ